MVALRFKEYSRLVLLTFHIVSKDPCSTPLSVVIIPTFVVVVASTKTLAKVDSGFEASVEDTINRFFGHMRAEFLSHARTQISMPRIFNAFFEVRFSSGRNKTCLCFKLIFHIFSCTYPKQSKCHQDGKTEQLHLIGSL